MAKDLLKVNQFQQCKNQAIYTTNELINPVIRKQTPENENPYKTISIVEKPLILIDNKKVKDSKY